MTIEFVVAFPVMLIVAAIAVNACSFFGVCAAFDNDFRDAVRTCATSPAYGQDVAQSCSLIEQELQQGGKGTRPFPQRCDSSRRCSGRR